MNKICNDSLKNAELKRMPFSVPRNYFEELEDTLHSRINPEVKKTSFLEILKPALGLLCSFAFIFGIGYGALRLTNTLSVDDSSAETLSEFALYDNITITQNQLNYLLTNIESLDSTSTYEFDDDDIINYLYHDEITNEALAYYYWKE